MIEYTYIFCFIVGLTLIVIPFGLFYNRIRWWILRTGERLGEWIVGKICLWFGFEEEDGWEHSEEARQMLEGLNNG